MISFVLNVFKKKLNHDLLYIYQIEQIILYTEKHTTKLRSERQALKKKRFLPKYIEFVHKKIAPLWTTLSHIEKRDSFSRSWLSEYYTLKNFN